MQRFVCIHGHFYQPPRENPWLESVELQDSAAPFHDWNERITAECYGRNTAARIFDGEGRIDEIVNNYSRISFNFGPTVLTWMKDKMPWVHDAIVEADKKSQERFSGHGSAIAQNYNHMIMPLANDRDKETQVLWGIRDFEHRFGRKPEGMWMAETGADTPSLEILAAHGIKFTILSPFQAKSIRKIDDRDWTDANGARIDPTRPYLVNLPSGKSINVFFYDAPVSQAVAFEKLLDSGEKFAHRIAGAFSADPDRDQLVHIATDGESYGHHHRWGEMALAYSLKFIEGEKLAKLTVYGEYLEKHPPSLKRKSTREAPGVVRTVSGAGKRIAAATAADMAAGTRTGARRSDKRLIGCATNWNPFSRRAEGSSSRIPGPLGPITSQCFSTDRTKAWKLFFRATRRANSPQMRK